MAGRTKRNEAIGEMPKDLDEYLLYYNNKRPHQGRNMGGRTPIAVFKSGIQKPAKTRKEKPMDEAE